MERTKFRVDSRNPRNIYIDKPDDPEGKGTPFAFALTGGGAELIVSALNLYVKMAGFPCAECKESYMEPCSIHPPVPMP